MKSHRAGDLSALACAVACGLGNIPAKGALGRISPELFNFYMFLFAWIFSSAPLLRKEQREEVRHINIKILGLILFLAILFAMALSLNMTALKLMEPATVSFLSRFEVVLTVALAYLILKEKLLFIEILGGVVALGGVFILKYETNLTISKGATLMVLSSLFFATAEIIIKHNITRIGTASFLFYRNLFLIPIFYLIIVYRKAAFFLPGIDILILTMAAGLLLPVLGRATYQMALKRINISRAALITQATPICTAIFAFLILGTYPTPVEWLGGALIIGGVVIVRLAEDRLSRKTI
jgi:drug/metabolite transporter, DME family